LLTKNKRKKEDEMEENGRKKFWEKKFGKYNI